MLTPIVNVLVWIGRKGRGTTTSFTRLEYTTVPAAEPLSTNQPPSLTPVAVGPPSLRGFRGPSHVRLVFPRPCSNEVSHSCLVSCVFCVFSLTLMAEGQRSPALRVADTWGTSSSGRGRRCRRTRGTVLTASRSSLCLLKLRSVLLDGGRV